jgi:hypothetical protein
MDYINYDLTIQDDLTTIAYSNGTSAMGKLQLNEQVKRDIEYAVGELDVESSPITESWIEMVGTKLADALFTEEIKSHFYTVKSQDSDKGIRIRLKIESPQISEYPWEALYENGRYLAVAIETPLTRFIPNDKPSNRNFGKPLKILVIGANPSTAGLPAINVNREIKVIEDSLRGHVNNGTIKLDIERVGTVTNIGNHLNQQEYNIIHFIGHGVFKDDVGYLALENEGESSELELADHKKIGQIFQNQRSLGLIVLNACQGAAIGTSKAISGLAPELVKIGIPSVIAMKYSITNQTSILFSREFYSNLPRMPIDENLQRVRQAILVNTTANPRDFITPILFMRALDGVIFKPNPEDTEADTLTVRVPLKDKIEELKKTYEKLESGSRTTDVKDFWLLTREIYSKYSNELDRGIFSIIRTIRLNVPILIKNRDDALRLGQNDNAKGSERAIMLNFSDLMDALKSNGNNHVW